MASYPPDVPEGCILPLYTTVFTENLHLWNSLEKVNIFLSKERIYLVSAILSFQLSYFSLSYPFSPLTPIHPFVTLAMNKNITLVNCLICEADCLDQEFQKPLNTSLGVQIEIFCRFL